MILYRREAVNAAYETLGVEQLYGWQEEVLSAAFQGEDIIYSAPTGGGKSLIYQILAVLEEGRALTLNISPLRALQRDQVAQLTARGIKAALLNSDLSKKEREEILDHLSDYSIVYLSPEQLFAPDLQKALKKCHLERVVVDEVHVLPQAAPSFRKAYGEIGKFIHSFRYLPQIIACTATATKEEMKIIITALGMKDPEIFTYPLRRNNLHLSVKVIGAKKRKTKDSGSEETFLFQFAEGRLQKWKKDGSKGSVIIYCPTVERVKALRKWLKGRDWKVTAYTGKMSQPKRLEAYEQFISGSRKIIVATNAFGLGINKPDVRLVIHAGLPLTLGGYVQEIGRAGRDGKEAECVLFYSAGEVRRNERILKQSESEEAIRLGIKGLNALKKLMDSSKCLWSGIEKYYGQKSAGSCGHCCNCKAKKAQK